MRKWARCRAGFLSFCRLALLPSLSALTSRRAASGQDQGNTGSEVDEAGSQKQSFFDDRSLDGALVFDPHSYLDYQTRKLGVWQRAGVFARAFLFLRLLLPCCAVLYFDVCPFVYPHRPMHAHPCTEIVIVAFSPDRGATLILIDAVLTTGTVEMDYSIKNYQAIQGERLLRYRVVIACLFIMILLILIDQVLCWSVRRDGETHFLIFSLMWFCK